MGKDIKSGDRVRLNKAIAGMFHDDELGFKLDIFKPGSDVGVVPEGDITSIKNAHAMGILLLDGENVTPNSRMPIVVASTIEDACERILVHPQSKAMEFVGREESTEKLTLLLALEKRGSNRIALKDAIQRRINKIAKGLVSEEEDKEHGRFILKNISELPEE